jgi:hypothetical protein
VGCAGGSWVDSTWEAEFPLGGPTKAYPTALRTSVNEPLDFNAAVQNKSPAQQAAPSSNPASSTSAQADRAAPQQRLDPQQPRLTPLAVVPPQYVQQRAAEQRPTEHQQLSPAAVPVVPTNNAALRSPIENELAAIAMRSAWSPGPSLNAQSLPVSAPEHSAVLPPPSSLATVSVTATASPITSPSLTEKETPQKSEASQINREERVDDALNTLIEALEADIRERRAAGATDERLPLLEQQLRLAYLAAGRLDDAARAVESLDQAQAEAFKHLMFGLGVWLSPDEARRAPLRSAKALRSLREATTELSAASKLEVRNVNFCEQVEHFGWYTEFPRKEFQPKQQVILYAEIENFTAEHKTPGGYETELQGSYEIYDSTGQVVARRQLQLDKEVCRNYRRDYYLAYRIYMPDNIAPGKYRLELTIEDLKAKGKYQGRKLGEGVIEFAIR